MNDDDFTVTADGDILHKPMNDKPIPALYAFLSVDENGNEGIAAYRLPGLGLSPLITGDEDLLPALEVLARKVLSMAPGRKIRLVKFTTPEIVKVIEP